MSLHFVSWLKASIKDIFNCFYEKACIRELCSHYLGENALASEYNHGFILEINRYKLALQSKTACLCICIKQVPGDLMVREET